MRTSGGRFLVGTNFNYKHRRDLLTVKLIQSAFISVMSKFYVTGLNEWALIAAAKELSDISFYKLFVVFSYFSRFWETSASVVLLKP